MVIVMERHDNYSHIYLEPGGMFQNRLGHFHHDDMIGQSVGAKIVSRSASGKYIRLLLPSPELWTLSIKQRTQIVQDLDQSMVVFMLGLRPGMRVLESGTGSGAMSHAILRTISPNGHLHTFEFNEARAREARVDFEHNRVGHLVTVRHADICQELGSLDVEGGEEGEVLAAVPLPVAAATNGSTPAAAEVNGSAAVGEEASSSSPPVNITPTIRALRGQMDAVFLDVPQPWLAIPLAAAVLKPNAGLATYSPCLEQVFKTCEALRERNFHSIRTMEVRHKQFDLWRTAMPKMDFGDEELRKEEAEEKEEREKEGGKEGNGMEVGGGGGKEEQEKEGKRKRGEGGGEGGDGEEERLFAKPRSVMRGHTAFLTFAVTSLQAPARRSVTPAAAAGGCGGGGGGGAVVPAAAAGGGADVTMAKEEEIVNELAAEA
jgi:tRNA (adenine57-N1/adenine58-N1)-methyltransferase